MQFERELLKGVLPAVVMEVLCRKAMYGYELSEELERRSKNIFTLGKGTLYPLLYNLEAKGLVKGTWDTGPTGRDRKYYALTAKGESELAKSREQLNVLRKGLDLVFQPSASPA
jgi:DNA-binding PadR family transcriptional regulator